MAPNTLIDQVLNVTGPNPFAMVPSNAFANASIVEETLTELSKATLGGYVKKATNQVVGNATKAGASWERGHQALEGGDRAKSAKEWNAGNASSAKAGKRARGINSAVAKLTKEELESATGAIVEALGEVAGLNEEQLQELSKATLGSYIKKAAESKARHRSDADYHTIEIDRSRSPKKIAKHDAAVDKHDRQESKRTKGIRNAVAKLTKEEIEPLSDEDILDLQAQGIDTLTLEEFAALVEQAAITLDESFESESALTEEDLQELSKATLGSYVKKASHDVATRSAAVARHAERKQVAKERGDWNDAKKHDQTSDKSFKKSWKRREKMAQAVDKLTKEEFSLVEDTDLQELSKMLLRVYKHKASKSKDTLADKAATHARHASDWAGEGMEKSAALHAKTATTTAKKVLRRVKGVEAASKKLKEEVELSEEQLQELSKATLGSYVRRAAHDVGRISYQDGMERKTKVGTKLKRRIEGISKASSKLAEEEQLQELSRETLISYAKKSSAEKKHSNHLASQFKQAADKEGSEGRKLSYSNIAKAARAVGRGRDAKIKQAQGKIRNMKEETELTEEQLQELSKATLASYTKKATASGRDAEDSAKNTKRFATPGVSNRSELRRMSNEYGKIALKRKKGVETASKKLAEGTDTQAETQE